MSYPRTVQVLVIEDDQRAKGLYSKIFQTALPTKKNLVVDPPKYAFCLEDGHRLLASADLATLEVTLLLQQDADGREAEIVEHCKSLFGLVAPPAPADLPRAENTRVLIQAIRDEVLKVATRETYALMVFDAALIQLGGLGYQSTGNKIRSHADAARVAGYAAAWLISVAPQLTQRN